MSNCPRCGQPLTPNSAYCAYCHEPVAQAGNYAAQYGYPGQPEPGAAQPGFAQPGAAQPGYQQPGYNPAQPSYPPQGYGQSGYPQGGYPQQAPPVQEYSPQQPYAQPSYGPQYGQTYGTPRGFQPAYGAGRTAPSGPNPFLVALRSLPQTVRGIVIKPGETLQTLVQNGDRFTGLILLAAGLLFAFFSTMIGMSRLLPAELLTSALGISAAQVAKALVAPARETMRSAGAPATAQESVSAAL